ncbi:DUF1330 domain-containing protein [Streptomyces flaveolus]|uniref:DUF1330 domain-containing protein n=1 Tax=Streptomyces flaveolus TaxID=67297 RepID=UPI003F57C28F
MKSPHPCPANAPTTPPVTGQPLAEARAWYASPAYQEILRLRTDHIDGDVVLVEGVGVGYDPRERAVKLRAETTGEQA